jgi:hypothetical protein
MEHDPSTLQKYKAKKIVLHLASIDIYELQLLVMWSNKLNFLRVCVVPET